MTENKRFYCKKDGNQWTVSDRLNQYPMPITSLEFCSVVANALNGLWEQTVRFEKYNQDYMKENEQLKTTIRTYQKGNSLLKTTLNQYQNENQQIRDTINEMHNNERTYIGKSVLKQLLNNIGEI